MILLFLDFFFRFTIFGESGIQTNVERNALGQNSSLKTQTVQTLDEKKHEKCRIGRVPVFAKQYGTMGPSRSKIQLFGISALY